MQRQVLLLAAGLVLAAANLAGQVEQIRVAGLVGDTITSAPLPFAIVSVANSTVTTLSNREGRYELRLPAGTWRLEFRKIGYEMGTTLVTVSEDVGDIDVFLRPLPVRLPEIVVTAVAEDPATRIIRRAIARKNDLLARLHDYRYEAYVKLVVRDLTRSRDSATAILLITETQTTAYWEQPGRYQEVIVARQQSENLDAENNLVAVGQIVNFNRERIDLQKYAVVSPTANDALDHYAYHLLDTLAIEGRRVFRLAIEPKSSASPLFVGMIDVADSTYDILGIDVGANAALRFDFLEHVRYRQRLRDHGNDRWMPYEISFGAEIHLGAPIPGFPRHLAFEHVASLRDFRFDEGEPPASLSEYLIVVADSADDADTSSWNDRRAQPLSEVERGAYRRIDSLERRPPTFGDRMLSGLGWGLVLSTNPDFFHFNRTEGPYLGAGWTWRDISPRLTLRTKLGYAIDRDAWQYRLGADLRLSERQRLWLGGAVLDEVTPRPTVELSEYNPTYLALLAKLDPLDYYRERGFLIRATTKLASFTELSVEYRNVAHRSVEVVTDYSLLDTERLQRANPPVVEGTLRSLTGAITFDSRRFLRRKGRDYRLGSLTFTRITAGAELAAPGLIANDFDYARYFLRLRRRQRTLNAGMTTIFAFAGAATGRVPPQRYFTVDFGKGEFLTTGDYNTLSETNFSGNRAASLVVSHDFDRLLFRKSHLPLVEKIPFTLLAHVGVFWTDFVDHAPNPADELIHTAPDPYLEIGFGLGNLTPMISPFNLAVYFSWQLTSYDTTPFELRVGIPFPGQ